MEKNRLTNKTRVAVFVFLCVGIVPLAVFAQESCTITFKAGARQTFDGFGAGSLNTNDWQQLPPPTREKLSIMVWKALDGRVFRLRVNEKTGSDAEFAEYCYNRYALQVADARAQQPNLLLLLDIFVQEIGDLQQHAATYSELLLRLRRDYNMSFYATGICNEPNIANILTAQQVPVLIKYFRQELDSRGLTDVKIVAPENSNVDNVATSMFQAINADPEAAADLYAYATHSYNMCLDPQIVALVPATKKYWQTECSANGPESFNDADAATSGAARFLDDINLDVDVWMWFLAYLSFDPNDNQTRLIGYNSQTGEYRPFWKYYYFTQITRTFSVGAVMRNGTTDLKTRYPAKYGSYDVAMEYQYGRKPPLNAAAGQNPDGTWGMAVANYTGVASDWAGTSTSPSMTYNVTFHIAELDGAPPQAYHVARTNQTLRYAIEDTTVLMQNGQVTVSVAPLDLVSLRPAFDITNTVIEDYTLGDSHRTSCGLSAALAFIPPVGFRCARLLRKRGRRKAIRPKEWIR